MAMQQIISKPLLCSIFAISSAQEVGSGTLAVTWKDCGAQHGTVNQLTPSSIEIGTTTQLTGAGTIDEDVTSAHFSANVKSGGTQVATCSGDAASDIVCKLPMGVGEVVVKAVSFPLAKGDVNIVTEVSTSKLIPASLANIDVEIRITEQNNEDVVCLDVHVQKASLDASASAQCSDDEQAVLSALSADDLGKIGGDCGKKSLSGLFQFDQAKFNACFMGEVSVGETCSQCYATSGQYGFDHCKAQCLLGWCKQGCLDCVAPATTDVATCTGVPNSQPTPCLDEVAV